MLKAALEEHRCGRLEEAAWRYRQILSSEPDHADCLHLLGMVAFQQGNAEQGCCVDPAGDCDSPDRCILLFQSWECSSDQEKMAEAEACCRQALALRPDQAEVHLNLGHILKARGDVEAALHSYRSARSLDVALAEAQVAVSTTLLLQGEFGAGWEGFESRWRTKDYDTRPAKPPSATLGGRARRARPGTDLGRAGCWGMKSCSRGSFVTSLREAISACWTAMRVYSPCLARSFPEVDVVSGYDPNRQPEMEIAAQLPIGSLSGLFRRKLEDFATRSSPYLIADAARVRPFPRTVR